MLMPMPIEYPQVDSHLPEHRSHAPLTPQCHDQDEGQNHQHHEQYQDQDVPMLDGGGDELGTLDKLLGCDTDAYIEEHMETYERAMNKWRDCSMEEWIAGADGTPYTLLEKMLTQPTFLL